MQHNTGPGGMVFCSMSDLSQGSCDGANVAVAVKR